MAFQKGPMMPTMQGGEPAAGNPFAVEKPESQKRCYRTAAQPSSTCPTVIPVKAPGGKRGAKGGKLR